MVKKQDIILAGVCTAATVASVLTRSPDIMALPIATIAFNRERIMEKLNDSGKYTEHEIKSFFREIDCLASRGEKKLKDVI